MKNAFAFTDVALTPVASGRSVVGPKVVVRLMVTPPNVRPSILDRKPTDEGDGRRLAVGATGAATSCDLVEEGPSVVQRRRAGESTVPCALAGLTAPSRVVIKLVVRVTVSRPLDLDDVVGQLVLRLLMARRPPVATEGTDVPIAKALIPTPSKEDVDVAL